MSSDQNLPGAIAKRSDRKVEDRWLTPDSSQWDSTKREWAGTRLRGSEKHGCEEFGVWKT